MCAPIPKGKWAWKYNSCIKCGTKKIKHKGRGLCLHCWDKERSRNLKRKEDVKKSQAEWYLRIKNNPELLKQHRENCRLEAIKWRKNPESTYPIFLKNRYKVLKFRRFLNPKKRIVKRDKGGIKFRCNGCNKHCLITSPIKQIKTGMNMSDLRLFEKVVIHQCFVKALDKPSGFAIIT